MSYLLCADDEPSIAALLDRILTMAGHEVVTCTDGRRALAEVARRVPDLLVLDRSMPHLDGMAVCRAVKSNPFLSRVPVLMLTAQATIDDKVEGFEAGADDYLAKPFEPRELSARVNALLRLVQRESERNPSSGLPGGMALSDEIERRLAAGLEFTVIYFDLDHFKPFADTFGFAMADRVITAVGAMLGELAANAGAFAGHIGGDDFLVIAAPAAAEALCAQGAQRFKEAVNALLPPEVVERGQFTGLDREGRRQIFPLAHLTAVSVPVVPAQWVSLAHLGEAAANWKKAARAQMPPETAAVSAR